MTSSKRDGICWSSGYRRALELGDDDSRVGLLLHLAELEIKEGRFEAALRCADEGIAIQEGSYAEQAQGAHTYVRALALACLGDTRRAREVAERGLEHCDTQGDVLFATMHRVTLGFLELSLRRDAEALEWISPIAERFAKAPGDPGLPHLACIPDAVECLTRLERLDDAEELLAAWDDASATASTGHVSRHRGSLPGVSRGRTRRSGSRAGARRRRC